MNDHSGTTLLLIIVGALVAVGLIYLAFWWLVRWGVRRCERLVRAAETHPTPAACESQMWRDIDAVLAEVEERNQAVEWQEN